MKARSGRRLAAGRPQHAEGAAAGHIFVQHGAQAAVGERLAHGELRQEAMPRPWSAKHSRVSMLLQIMVAGSCSSCAGTPGRHGQISSLPELGKRYCRQRCRSRSCGCLFAVLAQVGGRGHQQLPEAAQGARRQPRIGRLAGAHHGIETLLDHIHHAVGEVRVELDFGVLPHEAGQYRQHQRTDQRQAHAQAPARRGGGMRQFQLGRLDLRRMRRQRSGRARLRPSA